MYQHFRMRQAASHLEVLIRDDFSHHWHRLHHLLLRLCIACAHTAGTVVRNEAACAQTAWRGRSRIACSDTGSGIATVLYASRDLSRIVQLAMVGFLHRGQGRRALVGGADE